MACIAHTYNHLQKTSWCGKKLESYDWHFLDIDHAVYTGPMGSVARCQRCMAAIRVAMKEGYDPKARPVGEAK